MRVVGGSARGRQLQTPADRSIRPTADRIRESIFDMLGPGPFPERVLDLFAGTGALGIEALSRGAQQVVFVDFARQAIELITGNLRLTGFESRARVVKQDVLRFLDQPNAIGPFDLVLLDPPYGKDLVRQTLQRLVRPGWLGPGVRLMCESERMLQLPERFESLYMNRSKRYGEQAVFEFVLEREDPDQ